MPPMSVNSDALTPKARLALWIGWALNRDPKYWADGDQVFDQYITAGPGGGGGSNRPSKATEEQIDWEPVRQDLLRLKIPAWLITSTWRTHVWTGDSVKTGLYMWGFMDWAASKSSLDMLLDDSVRTSDTSSVQMVYARKGRRALVSNPPQWVQLGDPIVTPI
jgi:hypothetical protein